MDFSKDDDDRGVVKKIKGSAFPRKKNLADKNVR
jgi:hypothetical protein